MTTKESRVIRTRNITTGVISFLDKKSGKTVECSASELWPVELTESEGWRDYWANLPTIVQHLILHGVNGKVGDTVAAKDKDGPATMAASWKALVAGTWSQGGGGSPLDTYTTVLRQVVSDALVSTGIKRTDADKATRTDIDAAYLQVIVHLTPKGGDVKAGFDKVWPKIKAAAKTEANRRDNAAPTVDLAALLALPVATPKGPPSKKAA